MNRVTVRQQLQLLQRVGMSALTEEMQNVFLGLLDESADGLIGSYYNALTHQRMRIVSTGKFTIDTDNNPRGLKGITIDFNIPETIIKYWPAQAAGGLRMNIFRQIKALPLIRLWM